MKRQRYTPLSALKVVREFNAEFPVGTEVEYQGKRFKTWSRAGLDSVGGGAVFLENGPGEPVSLGNVTVIMGARR